MLKPKVLTMKATTIKNITFKSVAMKAVTKMQLKRDEIRLRSMAQLTRPELRKHLSTLFADYITQKASLRTLKPVNL